MKKKIETKSKKIYFEKYLFNVLILLDGGHLITKPMWHMGDPGITGVIYTIYHSNFLYFLNSKF